MRKQIIIDNKEEAINKFMKHVSPEPNSGCWLWTGWSTRGNYGCVMFQNKLMRAHRVAFMLFKGNISDDRIVCHTCDTPPCVNPAHLWQGTVLQNNLDSIKKGRWGRQRGERRYNAKISQKMAYSIKVDIKNGVGITKIAKKYGVNHRIVESIKYNTSWKWLTLRE